MILFPNTASIPLKSRTARFKKSIGEQKTIYKVTMLPVIYGQKRRVGRVFKKFDFIILYT